MSWFERHLNWTVLLNYVGVHTLVFIMAFHVTSEGLYLALYWGRLVEICLVCGWALRKKGRSLLWLLAFVVPGVGLILVLTAANLRARQTGTEEPQYRFIGDTGTRIYHVPACHLVQHIPDESELWFYSGHHAQVEGFEPCQDCNPDAEDSLMQEAEWAT